MLFETALADALYVSWAIPADMLPPAPPPLQTQTVLDDGAPFGFVAAVLFRQRGLRRPPLAWPRLSFPQCNLRLLVRDGEGRPAVLVLRELVPAWVVPLARGIGRQPVRAAIFDYPDELLAAARWSLQAGTRFVVRARPGAPPAGRPCLGDWQETVAFFRDRERAYVSARGKLRRVETRHPRVEALPMAIEVEHAEWLAAQLPGVEAERWQRPHSAFLVTSARLSFVVEPAREAPLRASAPAPG
jgi:hypothetical protein